MVFTVNIDSPRRNQVKMGNIINPVEDPMNLAVHTEPVDSTIILQAYQKAIEVGAPIRKAAAMGRSFHHSETYCALSWNQPITCPTKKRNIPMYIDTNAPVGIGSQVLF